MTTIFLIPSPLSENVFDPLPSYILQAIKECKVIFAENIRTTRRFFKSLDKSIIIDDFEWFEIHNAEEAQLTEFKKSIESGKNIGIISEAGCPGIADPGQKLIAIAQQKNCKIRPLSGPSSIILALMASGLNGQQFTFHGYLPIEQNSRIKILSEIESHSRKTGSTQLFIETPYRNNQLFESLINTCGSLTRLCIARDLTGEKELVVTKSISEWKKQPLPEIHKVPVIFLINAG